MGKRKPYSCPVEVTLELIGGTWKPPLRWLLKEHATLRHGALRRRSPEISPKALTEPLRQLEADEPVARTVYATVPPRLEPTLTPYGRRLDTPLDGRYAGGAAHARRLALHPPVACAGRAPSS